MHQPPKQLKYVFVHPDANKFELATPSYLSTLSSRSCVEYQYKYTSMKDPARFYLSPSTSALWSWDTCTPVVGTYYFTTDNGETFNSFDCSSNQGDTPTYGVGCSTGGGNHFKVIVLAQHGITNSSVAQAPICQDKPRILESGTCHNAIISVKCVRPTTPGSFVRFSFSFEGFYGISANWRPFLRRGTNSQPFQYSHH